MPNNFGDTIDQESLEQFEQQLTATRTAGAPAELRRFVLNDVERELRAARWDRRLALAAMILLAIGVAMNSSLALRGVRPYEPRASDVARVRSPESLIETAVVVAEATDAETGRIFARQLAAMSGRELSGDEIAAIDAAILRASTHTTTNGDRG